MHYFDIITFAVLGFFGFLGLRKGLVTEMFKLIGLIAAILMAVRFLDAGTAFLSNHLQAEKNTLSVLSFITIFLGTLVVIRIIAIIVKGLMQFAMMGWLDKTGGAAFGAVKGAVILSAVLWGVMFLPLEKYTQDIENNSKSYPYLRGFAPKVYDAMFKIIPGSGNFMDKMKEFLPDGKGIGAMAKFNNQDIMKQLEKQMGDQIDPDLLKGLSDENASKVLGQFKTPDSQMEAGSEPRDKFSEEQQKELEELLEKLRSESGDALPGIP